jgi:hypothetical protein
MYISCQSYWFVTYLFVRCSALLALIFLKSTFSQTHTDPTREVIATVSLSPPRNNGDALSLGVGNECQLGAIVVWNPVALGTEWHSNSTATRNWVTLNFHCHWKSSAARFKMGSTWTLAHIYDHPMLWRCHIQVPPENYRATFNT